LQELLRELRHGELSAERLRLVRGACEPGGCISGGQRVKLYLNAHGTEPAHLAGRCWGQGDAVAEGWRGFEDPSFGAKVAAMQSGDSDSLLVSSARYGREQMMQLLIEVRADVNQVSGYGESPLFAACLESQIGAVRILHEASACLAFVHEMTGLTLLGVSVRDFDMGTLIKGPGLDGSYYQRRTNLRLPTAISKYMAQLSVVRYLLETCSIAPVELELCAQDLTRNALYALLSDVDLGLGLPNEFSKSRKRVMQLLMEHGFNPNVQLECDASLCRWSPTPPMCSLLHMACLRAVRYCTSKWDEDYVVVRLMLEGKGDPLICDSHGETPIALARRKQHTLLIELLQPAPPSAPRIEYEMQEASAISLSEADPPHQLAAAASSSEPLTPASRWLTETVPAIDDDGKRVRRDTPMLTRAQRAGVASKLRQLPDSPGHLRPTWEQEAYKHEKQRLQVANQQIVARAERTLLKRMTRL